LDEQLGEAHDLLNEQVERIRESGAKVHGTHLEVGSPVDAILDLAEEVDAGLVVVGSRGLGPIERLALGSVSEGIVYHATRPVLVARGGERSWPPRRVVVGDDGSEGAERASELAAGIGKMYRAEGTLVRAYLPFHSKVSRDGKTSQLEAFLDALSEGERNTALRLDAISGLLPDVQSELHACL
jgi:nucleotide-binding universal stress UspA family protein